MKLRFSFRRLLSLVRDWNLKNECWLPPFHAGEIREDRRDDPRPSLRGAISESAEQLSRRYKWLLELLYDFDDEVLMDWERKEYGEGAKGKRRKMRALQREIREFRSNMLFCRHKLRTLPKPVEPPAEDLFQMIEQTKRKKKGAANG